VNRSQARSVRSPTPLTGAKPAREAAWFTEHSSCGPKAALAASRSRAGSSGSGWGTSSALDGVLGALEVLFRSRALLRCPLSSMLWWWWCGVGVAGHALATRPSPTPRSYAHHLTSAYDTGEGYADGFGAVALAHGASDARYSAPSWAFESG
jgi:hypothetical protein